MKKFFVFLATTIMAGAAFSQTTAKEWFDKGKSLRDEKKYKEAVDAFKKTVALTPNDPQALHELGWCYNELEMYQQALDALTKEGNNNPKVISAYFEEMGHALKGLKKYDDAIIYFNKAIVDDPTYSLPYKERGYSYFIKRDYEKALNDFKKYESLKENISDADFYYDKAWCLNEIGKYEDAAQSLNKCIQLDFTYTNAYSELGFSYYMLQRNDEALTNYKLANQMDLKNEVGIVGIGNVFYTNLKNYDSAMLYYEKATAFNKSDKAIYYKLGWCYNDKARYNDAVTALMQAVKIDPDYKLALEELGFTYYKLKMYNDGLIPLKKVVSNDPKSELGRYYAGLCYNGLGNKAELINMRDQLKAMDSKYATELDSLINQ